MTTEDDSRLTSYERVKLKQYRKLFDGNRGHCEVTHKGKTYAQTGPKRNCFRCQLIDKIYYLEGLRDGRIRRKPKRRKKRATAHSVRLSLVHDAVNA